MYEITSGIDTSKGVKVVIYGVEGIGKTTLASQFPDPVFIDTEGSTSFFSNIKRFPVPKDWKDLNAMIDYIAMDKPCKTIVIDTFDWAEKAEEADLLFTNGWKSIETPGYGKGYVESAERIAQFLVKLEQRIIPTGINVILTCHSQIRKIELPDERGSFDKYELKLGAKASSRTAPLVKEWADMILFCNWKTDVEITNNGNSMQKKAKARGGKKRMVYTEHDAVYDAKNRFGLPPEFEMSYEPLRKIFENRGKKNESAKVKKQADPEEKSEKPTVKEKEKDSFVALTFPDEVPDYVIQMCEKNHIHADDVQTMLYIKKITKVPNFDLRKIPEKFWFDFVKNFDEKYSAAMSQAIDERLPF